MEYYAKEIPSTESHEYKFAMSIIGKFFFQAFWLRFYFRSFAGTNINISAQRSGRNFFLDDKIGITFVHNMLEHLGVFLMPSSQLLKRMSLILLYNISICKRGALLIQMSKNGVGNILKCLAVENTTEIQTLALTLVNSMLEEIPTKEFYHQVMKNVNKSFVYLFF